MNRKQLAETVAEAYLDQFVRDERVMNDVIIVYDVDTEQFSSQSSLTPLQDGEIQVDTLVDGGFGDWDIDDEYTADDAEADMVRWLAEENDDYWNSIVEAIETPVEEY